MVELLLLPLGVVLLLIGCTAKERDTMDPVELTLCLETIRFLLCWSVD